DGGQISAAHGPVLVEQETGAVDAPVVIQILRFLKVIHSLVDPVLLLFKKSRVEPRRRITWVQVLGELELLVGSPIIAFIGIGLSQVASQQGSLRFHRGGDQEVLASTSVATANPAETTSQPRIAKAGINSQGTIEELDRLASSVLSRKKEPF